jgi:hypothetical protein
MSKVRPPSEQGRIADVEYTHAGQFKRVGKGVPPKRSWRLLLTGCVGTCAGGRTDDGNVVSQVLRLKRSCGVRFSQRMWLLRGSPCATPRPWLLHYAPGRQQIVMTNRSGGLRIFGISPVSREEFLVAARTTILLRCMSQKMAQTDLLSLPRWPCPEILGIN